MDSNNPIEKLRGWVRSTRADGLGPFGTSLEELDGIADALEAEIAEFKQQLAEKNGAICERDGRVNSYGLMNTELNDALSAICIRFGVDTELAAEDSAKKVLEALDWGWMRLPVDADGVPIRIGDEVKLHEKGSNLTVRGVGVNSAGNPVIWGVRELNTQTTRHRITDEITHVKPDTVESLLDEFMKDAVDIASDKHDVDWEELGKLSIAINADKLADYAERIRKVVEHG